MQIPVQYNELQCLIHLHLKFRAEPDVLPVMGLLGLGTGGTCSDLRGGAGAEAWGRLNTVLRRRGKKDASNELIGRRSL
ncbi:hypothetical protein EYF80_019320 [Liparis tanakae]|uniref:Uncharacterized protein n=1 Tax=Liparis tanakae TaxID=230148 RepID=A0A4Z2HZP9_9TELE|nr:hypothetical protein EYF80_019320 [Liparis tanakae]